jgi:hypothetical protein
MSKLTLSAAGCRLIQSLAVMNHTFWLSIHFLIPFFATLWLWYGVRKRLLSICILSLGLIFGISALLTYSVFDLFGLTSDWILARRLAFSAGLFLSGMITLAFTIFISEQSGNDS